MKAVAILTGLLQSLVGLLVAAGIVFIEMNISGPDIDGRTPPIADVIEIRAVEIVAIALFITAAFLVFRKSQMGWWLSMVVDGVIGAAAAFMSVGDIRDRFMLTPEGRDAFYGDLAIHSTFLLLCIATTGFLLLGRKGFFSVKAVG
jgi:hypothetical protein